MSLKRKSAKDFLRGSSGIVLLYASLMPFRIPDAQEYWRGRGDRAIAKSLLVRHSLLMARRESLQLRRRALESSVSILGLKLPSSVHAEPMEERLACRIICHHHHESELRRFVERFGAQLDRHFPGSRSVAN